MTEKKKREKVNAEITAAHLIQFAREVGTGMTQEDAIAFLNRNGRAYDMWKHMMQAGEDYIKQTLQREPPARARMQTPEPHAGIWWSKPFRPVLLQEHAAA
jgi:hypothetical protein